MAPDDPRNPLDNEWLDRYLAGEGTDEERASWRRRIDADPGLASVVAGIERAVARPERPTNKSWNVDAAWREALQRERADAPVPERGRRTARFASWVADGDRARGARRVGALAAAVVVIAAGVVLARRAGVATSQAVRELVSAPGSRTTVALRDGTRLVLGPASHLKIPGDFGAATRTVELDGEALFTVVHDAAHPFVVRTSRTTVRDVGTTFAVRAYATDGDAQVAVAEGEVAIGTSALIARDVASIDGAGRVTVRRGLDLARYLSWAQGGLVFKDTPLRQAVRDIARTYDLDVSIADSTLANEPVTASFSDESAGVVLDVVTRAVGARYERASRTVVIRRGASPAARPASAAGAGLRVTTIGGRR